MYCSNCGKMVAHGDRFCARCGALIHADEGTRSKHGHPITTSLAVALAVVLVGVVGAVVIVGPTELAERWAAFTGGASGSTSDASDPQARASEPASARVGAVAPAEAPSTGDGLSDPEATNSTPPTGDDLADVFAKVRSGVVKIRASTCDGSGVGSGFLVDEQTVVTAGHVVSGAVSVVVMAGGHTVEASVTGVDQADDLAVLALDEPLSGHQFALAQPSPAGSTVAVIGHPLGDPVTITQGVVSRLGRGIWPNVQIDAAINPGNSGGPVVNADGEVIGIVLAIRREANGIGLALRGDVAAPLVDSPSQLTPPEPALCAQPLGPDVSEVPEIDAVDDVHRGAAQVFADYFAGINTGDYGLAYDQLSPRLQAGASLDDFAAGVASSYDFGFDVRNVTTTPDGARVWLEFVSLQEPSMGPEGEGCTEWSLDYTLVWFGDRLLIHRAQGHDGSDGHDRCR